MRHSCIFAAISLSAAGLSGCGMEDSGPVAFNPATNVDVTFSSFTLTEATYTFLFSDLFHAVQPADTNDVRATELAAAIRSQLAGFLNLDYSTDEQPALVSVRNPLDLMHRVIGEDEIGNFRNGREYISSRIDEGVAGEYSNISNDVSIRFSDQQALLDGAPVGDYQWIYPILKWSYTPDTSNRVTRIINWVASGNFPEGSTRPSATLGTEFLPRDFQAIGYNDAARLHSEGSIVIEGEREMAFVREYDGLDTDVINIDGTATGTGNGSRGGPDFEFAGTQADCVKVTMNYTNQTVAVFMSLDEAPNDGGESNPAYCLNKEAPDDSYQGTAITLRP
ncbi:hypothetical protein FWJ25_08240 [Marinobacter salinexigens]|uniref:Uncharacterized protein n=1 Tax=Marinobacter salinexigens TaxID=2919747 RepID=A0A5B0VIH2_9GAMM|nr:hypothetical protein [Marinobacter salinexigens]KAA1174224.1 hypothetical protein FWJ25_08240 [Marinobacter salinexigens]